MLLQLLFLPVFPVFGLHVAEMSAPAYGGAAARRESNSGFLSASFDLRHVGGRSYVGPVRNQHLPIGSRCASCWAVTSASVMGARLNMMIEKAGVALPEGRIEVSAQVLLNCLPGQDPMPHCGYPGSSNAAMDYVSKHGIPDESCAPYENTRHECDALHTCADVKANPRLHNHEWPHNQTIPYEAVRNPRLYYVQSNEPIPPNDTLAIMRSMQTGPVPCGVHAEGLTNYSSGIITGPDHPMRKPLQDDHSVALVGWGTENGIDYWVLQNVWGTRWGEGGFCRIKRGIDLLGIEGSCHHPVMKMPSWLDAAGSSQLKT
jgi:cathepsin X